MLDAAYKRALVDYSAELFAARTGLDRRDAMDVVHDPIRDELRHVDERGLDALDLPMGQMMIGLQDFPNAAVGRYIEAVRGKERLRWHRHRVTQQDIVEWWDLGVVVHRCWFVLDNLISMTQFTAAMRSRQFDSMEEAVAFSEAHVKRYCALYGDAGADDGTPDGRLPLEIRSRVDAWSSRMSQENPTMHIFQIEGSDSFNALCRTKIAEGEI